MSEKIYAVLTGDIVKSRRLTAEQSKALQQRMKSAASEFNQTFSGTLAGKLGITRGDGWQVALQKPEHALRLALYLRAIVKSEFDTDTRVSIGIGSVDRLELENIIESTGLAFERSGHGLEMVRRGCRLTIDSDAIDRGEELIIRLLDCIVSRWTSKAAIALAGVLLNQTHDEISENSPISERSGKKPTRQAVGDALGRASWPEVQACIEFFGHLFRQV